MGKRTVHFQVIEGENRIYLYIYEKLRKNKLFCWEIIVKNEDSYALRKPLLKVFFDNNPSLSI
ncbi:hypothetical protein JCM19046_4454 [Bacillus sp. JCM 19046]|nr:hypothetical protein JCM19045_3185 [Bacillus sp. JCM 19045]GAF19776.1 hypothetical protein JCM19046_4454 [Bacillus sp. JCM 19046]